MWYKKIKSDCGYAFIKEFTSERFEEFYKGSQDLPCGIVNYVLDNMWFDEMEEGGMSKFFLFLVSTLFEIEKKDFRQDLAYTIFVSIKEFDAGLYDELIAPEDMPQVKADVETVKAYFAAHPKMSRMLEGLIYGNA